MRVNATGETDHSPLQNGIDIFCVLAYRSHVDVVDEYVQIGEITSIECLEIFVMGINEMFVAEFLRRPNNNDIDQPIIDGGETCLFRYAKFHQLYALGMKKLSSCVERTNSSR
jgi:hypothetical protein